MQNLSENILCLQLSSYIIQKRAMTMPEYKDRFHDVQCLQKYCIVHACMHAYQGRILLHVKHCRNAKIGDHVHIYPQHQHISAMAEAAGDSRHVQSVLTCMQGSEWAHVQTCIECRISAWNSIALANPPPLELSC